MYERNAIILERYFDKMFGYNMKNNLKTNFSEYSEMVKCREDYINISEEEETIMQEYDSIANRIREVQKIQEDLSKRNLKLQEDRDALFQNIDEKANVIQKKLQEINENIIKLDEDIKINASNFVEIVAEFSEKTINRTACERKRRNIENEYRKRLYRFLDDYKEIDIVLEEKAKQFVQTDTEAIEEELREKIQKNGEEEKIPFNMDVVTKAICLSVDIQKRETEILADIYEKTNRLFTEIKSNTVRLDKHKKTIKDSSSKLEFISAIKEYLFQFLDNERLTAVNGEEEHNKLMKDACKYLDEDLVQINNLYTLLLKEISKKITKKSYSELYKVEYLKELEKKADEFDKEVKKLNLPVTVINPNYWRIEGMKKIYNVFYKNVTENYGRDLSEYITDEQKNITEDEFETESENNEFDFGEEKINKKINNLERIDYKKNIDAEKNKEDISQEELDKKIDMILGFNREITNNKKKNNKIEDNDGWNDEDDKWLEEIKKEAQEPEDAEDDDDIWDDEEDDDEIENIWADEDEENNEENDEGFEEDDDFWGEAEDDDEKMTDDIEEDDDEKITDDIEEDDDENVKDDMEENEEDEDDESIIENIKDKKNKRKNNFDDDWGNEFIKTNKKEKNKKKRGFFDKFKK